MTHQTKLSFYGGAGRVTGSNFLLETETQKVLVDCGLFQGCDVCEEENLAPFPYDPSSVDALFVTHAHLDHTGRIPRLVNKGFRGRIISTPPTKEIAELMFEDGLGIMAEEAKRTGRELPYSADDAKKTMSLWETVPYHETVPLADSLSVHLKDAGHILGSAMAVFTHNGKNLVFTGDLGNSPMPLLKNAESVTDAAYLVTESVYGDKEHEDRSRRREILEDVIEETVRQGGALLIPAFSIERTQELLYEIEMMMHNKRIPAVPVFLDSPLAIQVTDIYKKYHFYFNKSVGKDLFSSPKLTMTRSPNESKRISDTKNPKIIVAGSGMSTGGRILFHEKEHLPDPKSTLLIVGYQAPGSLGREIEEGAKEVTVFGKRIPVRARVETIQGYSAHKDSDDLLAFIADSADMLKKIFVVMGEPKASAFLTQRIRDYLGVNAVTPEEGDTAMLDF